VPLVGSGRGLFFLLQASTTRVLLLNRSTHQLV
jgi:hypothetical protein